MAIPSPSGPRPAVVTHLTRTFAADVETLHEQCGAEADAILRELCVGVGHLKELDAFSSLPIVPHGRYGDSFMFNFNHQFSFTFRRMTDRDEQKQPIVIHFYLKNILRRP